MSLRLIDSATPFGPFGNAGHIAKIHWNSEFQEYRVRLYINGKPCPNADYFTDDKQDAENTAIRMVGA
jgi:hypothetical protein